MAQIQFALKESCIVFMLIVSPIHYYTWLSFPFLKWHRDHFEGGQDRGFTHHAGLGLAEACRFVHNDAKYVNERARNDIILLSRYLTDCN